MILRKIFKTVATRCHGFQGHTLKTRKGKGRERKNRGKKKVREEKEKGREGERKGKVKPS